MSTKNDFLKHVAQTSPFPFSIDVDRAEGLYIWDKNGKRFTDFISGVSVSNLGHRHPSVIKAIKEQVDKYLHVMVYGEYIQEPQVNLALKLKEILPDSLDTSYFVNSGTEANEAALKLAKRVTGRAKILSFRGAYHGSTHGSLSVSGNETKKQNFRPLLPGIEFISFNNIEDLDIIDSSYAAVIIEPIQGDAGVRIPSKLFLQTLREKCTKNGVQLIFDEIQTGFGRTGKLFAFEHFGVTPDILTLAKGLGGGMHMGAFVSSYEKMQLFTHDPMLGHITTFGGHPVSCAAALANVTEICKSSILNSVEDKGYLVESLLKHAKVKEIRRKGLFFAIDLDSDEEVQKVVDYCMDKGVITFWFLSHPASFRIAPPLNITEEQIKETCKVITEAFDTL